MRAIKMYYLKIVAIMPLYRNPNNWAGCSKPCCICSMCGVPVCGDDVLCVCACVRVYVHVCVRACGVCNVWRGV